MPKKKAPAKRVRRSKRATTPIPTNSLEILLQLLSSLYPKMRLEPGITLSYLASQKLWYAAAYIYPERLDPVHKRLQVASAKHPTFDGCIAALCEPWVRGTASARTLVNKLRSNYGGRAVDMDWFEDD